MIRYGRKQRGYSLMELIVAMVIAAIALSLFVPNGKGTKDVATTRSAAEEMVARFRAARAAAITKGIPVAVAIPRTPSIFHSDEGFRLEGDVSPQVTDRWKIQQQTQNVVYYTGKWPGPNWAPAPVLTTVNSAFDPTPAVWFGPATPPNAAMYVFTPSGNAVSSEDAADGRFRMIVGMGIDTGSNLTAVNSAFTIWIDPSGEIGLDRGVFNGPTVAVANKKESLPLAPYVPVVVGANNDPVLLPVPPSLGAMSYPNNVNPKTNNGNVVDLDAVLTLEVRVRDDDGDPPYFKWKAVEAGEVQSNGTTFVTQSDMDKYGGRFSNTKEVRMEWDAETKEWVGRDTWAPSTLDKGGNRYKLQCDIVDRKGGSTTAGFPVDGNYLVTTKEPWVLYKTWNTAGVVELWKMTLDGLDHTPLVQFGYQDVEFGQWSPSGAEVIVGAPDGVYRVTSNGENLQKVSSVVLPGGIDGCCISPSGDAVYYLGGPFESKRIRKVIIDGSGTQVDVALNNQTTANADNEEYGTGGSDAVDYVWDLSAVQFESGPGKVVLLHTMYHYDKKKWKVFGSWKTKRKYAWGAMALDADTGDSTNWQATTFKAGNNGGSTDSRLAFGQDQMIAHGTTIHNTDVPSGGMGEPYEIHVMYGDTDPQGTIHIRKVDPAFGGGSSLASFQLAPGAVKTLPTNRADTHHPKYAHPDRGSVIFAAGRDQASRIYYMHDINNPTDNRELPLHPSNQGAEAPSVSRPR